MTTTTPTTEAEKSAEENLPRMSLGDHLDELRRRLAWSLLAIVGSVVLVLPFKDTVTAVYTEPYNAMWMSHFDSRVEAAKERTAQENAGEIQRHEIERSQDEWLIRWEPSIRDGTFPVTGYPQLISQGGIVLPRTLKSFRGVSDIWVFMGASMLFGVLLGAPVVLYQAWAFLAAGLYSHEKKVVLKVFPFALFLLMSGISFGFFVAVPNALFFLVKLMNPEHVTPVLGVAEYFGFLLMLTAALGVTFQLPVLMYALDRAGIVAHDAMKKNWRWVILLAFVFSAFLTPPDPFTQLMMAGPLCVLYIVGLLVTRGGSSPTAEATA